MATLLFATQPITGHVLPALPVVAELTARGHAVHWYSGRKFRERVERSGAVFEPYDAAYDYDDADYDAAFPGRSPLSGLDRVRFDFEKMFVEQMAPQHRDLRGIVERCHPDAVVGDPSVFAAFSLAEAGGPPNAVYNITCLGIPGRELAPFGLGLRPSGSLLGRARNRMLEQVAARVVFRRVSAALEDQCRQLAVRRRRFTGPLLSPYLYLQPSVPSFEYARSDLPGQVHFVGALLPPSEVHPSLPDWWSDLDGRAVVLVTQGTVATSVADLVAPTLRALADEDLLVVAAGVADPSALETSVPDNARCAPYVPFGSLMPRVRVFITNGGFGGVHHALTHGVPVVVAGTTEDKPEVANRVAASGVGVNLRTSTPTPEEVLAAVRRLFDPEATERIRAAEVRDELAAHDGPRESSDLLERLAATGQPVLNH